MKHCPYGRGIIGGLVVGVYGWLVGWLVWMQLFKEETLAHAQLWRPHGDPLMLKGMIAAYLVVGLFYSLLYAKLSSALTCVPCKFRRGIAFGFLLWLPFGLGCSLFWYTLSPIWLDLLYASIIDKALFLIGGGFLLSLIYGNALSSCTSAEGGSCSMPEQKTPAAAVATAKKKPAAKKKK